MLRENLQDAGEIIQNILTEPLDIPDITENISLLSAARNFLDSDGESPELSRIIGMFQKYPESTRMLITELEIISSELS